MVCANPDCRLESSYLRGGSLYWIDVPPTVAEAKQKRFIWLCSNCCSKFTVESWRPPGSQLRPLRARADVQLIDSQRVQNFEQPVKQH